MVNFSIWVRQQWQKKGWVYYSLKPLSWVFGLVVIIRRFLYQEGWFRTYQALVPVLVVGNLTVGGTGKTPLVMALTRYLAAHGYRPGIVSRGYGSCATAYPHLVQATDTPKRVGDEPYLLFQHLKCPMVIDPNRARATAWLLSQCDCDLIISDDGLQHLALARDIEIIVIDEVEKFGNQALLPAGPMRESASRMENADLIVVKNAKSRTQGYKMILTPTELYRMDNKQITKPLSVLNEQTVHLVTGIGEPNQLVASMEPFCKKLVSHIFSDHHQFTCKDFINLTDQFILMTEKDAVKCQALSLTNIWVIKIDIELPKSFFTAVTHLLQYVKQYKQSSALHRVGSS